MIEREIPEHAQMIIMPSDLKKLKEITGETSTKAALTSAVEYALKHMKEKKKEK